MAAGSGFFFFLKSTSSKRPLKQRWYCAKLCNWGTGVRTYLCFLKEFMLQQLRGRWPERNRKMTMNGFCSFELLHGPRQKKQITSYDSDADFNQRWRIKKNLFSGSFIRHKEIIFLKDLPYFFTISLSVMPVSRAGGSFCSVSIKTWEHKEHIRLDEVTPSQMLSKVRTEGASISVLSGLTFIGGYLW